MGLDWRLGTVGFGYQADWGGVFYPKGMKTTDYLKFYAQRFAAVELDNTFHAMPTAERVEKWASAVPDGFEFCVKTPREITHDGPLGAGVKRMLYFLDVVRRFGAKLGVVLLQFPPTFQSRETETLREFLAAMPPTVRLAVELRHASWNRDSTFELLQNAGAAWVAADYGGPLGGITATTDFLYVRWIGVHQRFEVYDRERVEVEDRLRMWKARILAVSSGVHKAYGLFGNDFSGYAIATAGRFGRMVGVAEKEVQEPPMEPPAQGSLFG
jgi:uncharacterized protein YecE (DUF72 family)